MVTEKHLEEGILECMVGKPTPEKMVVLSAYYTVRDHLFGKREKENVEPDHRMSREAAPERIDTSGHTDFLALVSKKDSRKVIAIMNDLMEMLKTYYPKEYDHTMARLQNL